MRTDSRPATRRAGVVRFRAVLVALCVCVIAALTGCASTVGGSPVAGAVPMASPVAPFPVAPTPSPTTNSAPTTPDAPTSPDPTSPDPTSPDPTSPDAPTATASDPSTEILTVTTYPPTPVTEPAPPTVTGGSSRSTGPVIASKHRGTAKVVDGGGVLVHLGSPKVKIDIFDEPLCPPCAAFTQTFGPAIDKAVDAGTLAVTYRTVTFLDSRSFSGSYSTRASAALLCVAHTAGSRPGLFQDFYAALFSADAQPEEDGTEDLTDDELAGLAAGVGAPEVAVSCIRAGSEENAAMRADVANRAALAKAGAAGTPAVVRDGKPIDHKDADWLTHLVGG